MTPRAYVMLVHEAHFTYKPLHPYMSLPVCSNVTFKPIPHTYPHTHCTDLFDTYIPQDDILTKKIQQENNKFKIKTFQ